MKIYTITLNPSLDEFIWVEELQNIEVDSMEIKKELVEIGGKGISVSRALANLEIKNTAIGLLDGPSRIAFKRRIREINKERKLIQSFFIPISGSTRQNLIVNEINSGEQFFFRRNGPVISINEIEDFFRRLSKIILPSKEYNENIVVIGGSLPDYLNPEIVNRIIEVSKEKGAIVVLDASGDALKNGITAQPDLIKPNIQEVQKIWGAEIGEANDFNTGNFAKKLQERYNIPIVLISLGARGIILAAKNEIYHAIPPNDNENPDIQTIDVRNTIGAGDSAVAGFILGWQIKKRSLKDSLIFAVAAGTATTWNEEPVLCQFNDFIELIPRIKLKDPITGLDIVYNIKYDDIKSKKFE